MVVKHYREVSYRYKKIGCGLKNIVIKSSVKVYNIHIIKQLFIFNFKTM